MNCRKITKLSNIFVLFFISVMIKSAIVIIDGTTKFFSEKSESGAFNLRLTLFKSNFKVVKNYLKPVLRRSRPNLSNRILIFSEGRSGSSMLGEILCTFAPPSGCFYTFEPLWPLVESPFANQRQEFHRYGSEVAENLISDSLNCSFADNEHKFLFDIWPFKDRSLPFHNLSNKDITDRRSSLKTLARLCRKSQLKIVKIIRLNYFGDREDIIYNLLSIYPDLIVIGLIRDPRAVYNSRYELLLLFLLEKNLTSDTIYPAKQNATLIDTYDHYRVEM